MDDSDHEHGHGGHNHGDGHDSHNHGDDGHDPVHDHDHEFGPLGVAVVTISSSRTLDEDSAGDAIEAAVESEGNEVVTRELVADEYDGVQGRVDSLVNRDDAHAVVTTGGTGVTPDDVTIEAIRPLLNKELPGFGELFRARSREEIGTRVVATRATAGVADGVPVFCLPGSENAARLGAGIVVEEAGHLAGLAGRDGGDEADDDEATNGAYRD